MSPSGRSCTPSRGCSRSLRVQRELSPANTSLTCPRLPMTGSSRPMTTLPSTAPPYVPAPHCAEHPRPPDRPGLDLPDRPHLDGAVPGSRDFRRHRDRLVQILAVDDEEAGDLFPGRGERAVSDDHIPAVPAPHRDRRVRGLQPLA